MKKTAIGYAIGKITIPYYGLFIVIGIACAALIGWLLVKRFKKDMNDFIIMTAFTGLGGIVGAKLLYLIVNFNNIDFSRITEPEYLNQLMSSGFVFYGGLITGLLCLKLTKKIFKIDVGEYANICLPCLPIVHGFGRLGCDAVGCCYGIEYSGPFSKVYDMSILAPNHMELFPVQRTESIAEFIIAAILIIYIVKSRKPRFSLDLYLILYAPVRFILEYLRNDTAERGMFGVFSTSQWISIAIVAAVVIRQIYIRVNEDRKRTGIT